MDCEHPEASVLVDFIETRNMYNSGVIVKCTTCGLVDRD